MGTLTTRRELEVTPRDSGNTLPTLFITTAMPKSGSNWLEAMIFSLPRVGGFGARDGSCGFLTLSALTRVPEALPFLERSGLNTGDALARMLDSSLRPGSSLPQSAMAEAERIVSRIRLRIPPRTGLLAPDKPSRPTLSRLMDPLFEPPHTQPAGTRQFDAIGCPAKHEPAWRLAERLPGWKVVQLIRDPRDVLVSRFYHDLAHMDPGLASLFVTGSGGHMQMRPDWLSAYFSKRLEELLTFYERFESPESEGASRLILRYEDLLADTGRELAKAAAFIGLAPNDSDVAEACNRFAFERIAAGDGAQTDAGGSERRNSFLRKGQAGDWMGYFDRRLTGVLGAPFNNLLVRLGYEPDDRWVQRVPTSAERAWDFARLRPRASLARSFRTIWEADPVLQEKYPDPTDVLAKGQSFVDHLAISGDKQVLAHRATLIAMSRLWNADVRETAQF